MIDVQLYGGPFDGLVIDVPDIRPVYRVAFVNEEALCLTLDKIPSDYARVAVYCLRYVPSRKKTGRRVPRYEFERIEP